MLHLLFHTRSPLKFGVSIKTIRVVADLTAVGARLMTSSGFPSVLCYSELFGPRRYSSSPPLFSAPSSQPPLTWRGCRAHVSPLAHVEVSQSTLVSYVACLAFSVGWEKNRLVWCITWCLNMCTSILKWNIFTVSGCGWKKNFSAKDWCRNKENSGSVVRRLKWFWMWLQWLWECQRIICQVLRLCLGAISLGLQHL